MREPAKVYQEKKASLSDFMDAGGMRAPTAYGDTVEQKRRILK